MLKPNPNSNLALCHLWQRHTIITPPLCVHALEHLHYRLHTEAKLFACLNHPHALFAQRAHHTFYVYIVRLGDRFI